MVSENIVQIKNLTHIYNAGTAFERRALDNVSLDIRRGSFVGLIGHTGSGKSTLIQHINILLRPSSGNVMIDGEDIAAIEKKHFKRIREKVGLVFQYPEHQLFETTVYKDVAFGPQNMGLPPDEVDRRVRQSLTWVGISDEVAKQSPFELSGGQKRRAAIAGVLAMNPQILILDEPTAGLDPHGRAEILDHVSAIHKDTQNTVVLVSHNMEEVSRLTDTIFVMAQGKVVCSGTPSEVFSEPGSLRQNGLDAPQINQIMYGLRMRGMDVPIGVFTAEEAAQAIASAWWCDKMKCDEMKRDNS